MNDGQSHLCCIVRTADAIRDEGFVTSRSILG